MRASVIALVELGRLPEEEDATVPDLEAFEAAIKAIDQPISDSEAVALLPVFPTGEGSCFGLAWSLLHLVETAPGWPCEAAQLYRSNPWVSSMLQRAERA